MELSTAVHDGGEIFATPRVREVAKYPRPFPKLFKRWFGLQIDEKKDSIGKGTYGRVYQLTLTTEMLDYFRHYASRMVDRLGSISSIPVGTKVAVKVSFLPVDKDQFIEHSYAMMLREMNIHDELHRKKPVYIEDKEFSIRSSVPTMYFAGIDRDVRASVTIMRLVKGETLNAYINRCLASKGRVHPSVLGRFEHALLSLWLSGYFHLDLHSGNVFYDEDNRQIMIIDFGMAVKIPDELASNLVEYIKGHVYDVKPKDVVLAFWEREGKKFADKVVYGRYKMYHSPKQYWSNISSWKELAKFTDLKNPELEATRKRRWIPGSCDANRLKGASRRVKYICTKKPSGFFSLFGGS